MHDSIHDDVSGTVEIVISLAQAADSDAAALEECVARWLRAVEIGYFGPCQIRLDDIRRTRSSTIAFYLSCRRVSRTAFRAFSRIIECWSAVGECRVDTLDIRQETGVVDTRDDGVPTPSLPLSLPFEVNQVDDLHAAVRVEIEFREPLTSNDRQAIFRALTLWKMLVDAFNPEELWEEPSDCVVRLLSPSVIECEITGYAAGFECLDFVIWLGVRLHQRRPIEAITFES
ncbi:hypothetical protein [Caballeronia sp. J97]|uniref:hypothetical protein n=1 Tax=Caballeronia sp. J97 TaxID=2805429 RepID=UPI002AB03F4B|nr:hypothetical protein [Caballeronia sp. J97]